MLSQGKREFADVSKVRGLKIGRLTRWANLITWTLKSRELSLGGGRRKKGNDGNVREIQSMRKTPGMVAYG